MVQLFSSFIVSLFLCVLVHVGVFDINKTYSWSFNIILYFLAIFRPTYRRSSSGNERGYGETRDPRPGTQGDPRPYKRKMGPRTQNKK